MSGSKDKHSMNSMNSMTIMTIMNNYEKCLVENYSVFYNDVFMSSLDDILNNNDMALTNLYKYQTIKLHYTEYIIRVLKEEKHLSLLKNKKNYESLIKNLISVGYIMDLFSCISEDFVNISNNSCTDLSLLISVSSLLLSTKKLMVYYEKLIEIDDVMLTSSIYPNDSDNSNLPKVTFNKDLFFENNSKRVENILYKNILELLT